MTEWADNPDELEKAKPEEEPKLGPTGEHPDGKIQEDDEGELQFACGTTKTGDVFLDFGVKVKWIAMEPAQAIEFAKVVAANAAKAARVRQILEKQQKGAGLVGADGRPLQE
jgi:hypothetical protein